MTGVFDDFKMAWDGKEYAIPANRIMGAIRRVEVHVTLKELYEAAAFGNVRMATLADAYAALLGYVGVKITPDEVYAGMFGDDGLANTRDAVEGLLQLMLPPAERARLKTEGEKALAAIPAEMPQAGEGNRAQRRAQRAAARSSRKHTEPPASGA